MANSKNNDPISVMNMWHHMKADYGIGARNFNDTMIGMILYRYALNRVQWIDLPPRVSPVLIEQLMIEGRIPAIHQPAWSSEPLLYVATPVGNVDNQRLHAHYSLQSINGLDYIDSIRRHDIALLDPRYTRLNVALVIGYYADKFNEFEKAIRSNLRAQRTPIVLIGPRSQRLTLKNIADDIEQGEPYRFEYNDSVGANQIVAQNFNVNYIVDKLLVDRRAEWNDVMTWLGIDNINQDKRERMVMDEVSGNSEQIEASRFIELNCRRDFGDSVYDLFGYPTTAVWRHDSQTNNHIMHTDDTVEDSDDVALNGGIDGE